MIEKNLFNQIVSLNKNTDYDRLAHLYWAIHSQIVFNVPGDFCEIGCNEGLTSVFINKVINSHCKEERKLFLYDGFAGLPKRSIFDSYLNEGDLKSNVSEVYSNFGKFELSPPCVVQGDVFITLPSKLPKQICFAYIDLDFYEPTLHALLCVFEKLVPLGLIVVDDYSNKEAAPYSFDLMKGVSEACSQFSKKTGVDVISLPSRSDLAFGLIRKL